MKISKIIKINSQTFLDDLKKATVVKVYASKTDSYYNITKKEVISDAALKHIDYFMSENIDYSGCYTMVVL